MTDQAPTTETEEAPEAAVEETVETPADEAPATDDTAAEEAVTVERTQEIRLGNIVNGTVAKLVDFGAFVDIVSDTGQTVTGLVHVSEIATGFVENIYAHLAEGEIVDVKVVSMGDDGKIGLSIKQAQEGWEEQEELDRPRRSTLDKNFDRRLRKFMHGSQSIQGEVRRQRRSRLGWD